MPNRHIRKACIIMLALLITALASLPVYADPVIYTQPSDFPGGTVFSSQNDTNPGGFGGFATASDNFILRQLSIITDVHWQGGYFNGGAAAISAFTVTFSADAPGSPGAALLSQTIPGNANETFVGNQFFGPVFDYSVDLPVSFLAQAGTTYWLSIVPSIGFPPQWGWHTGTGGDGVAHQAFFGTGTTLGQDLAFDLTGIPGSAIPAPATLILLASGLIGLIGARQCRSRSPRNRR